jgi:ATP-dependent Zn protease
MISSQQQVTYPEELLNGSIEQQVDFLFNRASDYSNNGVRYKVSRTREFEKLRDNISDSLKENRKIALTLKQTIDNQNGQINKLKEELTTTTKALSNATNEKDSVNFFGQQITKGTYNLIVWIVLIILSILLGHFIFRFTRSNAITQESKAKLTDLEIEFEDYRRKALEREQRISRQLHDEINKNRKSK